MKIISKIFRPWVYSIYALKITAPFWPSI